MPPPPPGSSSHQSRANGSSTPSPTDGNELSSSRMSKDSEGYPSWLPKRPPPPAPASTFQSSILGGPHTATPSPVEPLPFVGGRKPTPRSVRIVSLQNSFVGGVEKEGRFEREPTDQTRVGVHVPPKVWTRSSGIPPTAFNASEHDEFLPLPQPRFKVKNLHLEILESPSKWMRLYYYLWPLFIFYHIPLQTYFDFNAVFILLQVAKFPNPLSSGKNWALGAAAYIACWFAWIFVVCVIYELVYSFTRRWRLRRPLMLPIYLSSPAFNYVALTSYINFSFLQYLRFSAFYTEETSSVGPQSPSDPEFDLDDIYGAARGSWKQGLAETFFFYSQNVPTVALLLPRAGLSLALLFQFSSAAATSVLGNSDNISKRDGTWFRQDGALTDYARGVLIANAAWTGWRILVLLVSWLGLWIFSNQRLGGLCGPRHTWEESEQEKTRSIYSEAASEYGAYRGSFYQGGEASNEYGGDELPWEWREATRVRLQDAFEFCVTTRKRRSDSGDALRWSTASGTPVPGYGYAMRNRRYRNKHRRRGSAKGKEPSSEKAGSNGENADEPFEGLERVLAAAGFPTAASPSRRGVLSEDLFAAPVSTSQHPDIEPLMFQQTQPTASSSMFTGLEAPKMAKRNSKDKVPGSGLPVGAPLLSLPYPFSKPGAGHVSSKDSVPFPAGSSGAEQLKSKSSRMTGQGSKSGSSATTSSSESGTGSGSGSTEEDDDDDDEDDDDDDDDEDDEEEEEAHEGSEEPSTGRASGSMSSLGQPISPQRYPFGMRRPAGVGHGRSMSGVSSGLSSGPGMSSGSHGPSHSMSSSHGAMSAGAMSVITHSTGNDESIDSEARDRASLSQGSSNLDGHALAGSTIPMPPRHPHPHGQGRGRSSTAPSGNTPSAAATLSSVNTQIAPVAFPSVRRRADSGRGVVVNPTLSYGESLGSDIELEGDLNVPDDSDHELPEDEEEEQHDRVGLLGVSYSPRSSLLGGSRVSLHDFSSSGDPTDVRSRTHSAFSSRSRHSSTRARSRSRTHSSHSLSVRDRANSLGASMRSLVQGATASLTQLDLVMRGATGPAAGLGGLVVGGGSRPRSRVNSSMARLEEDVVFSPSTTEMSERRRDVSGTSSGSGSHSGADDVIMNPLVGRTRQQIEAEAEGYSSGGTHSRSGSESVSGENYTFGRPIPFMRPPQQQDVVTRAEEESQEIVPAQRTSGTAGRGSPERSAPIPIEARTEQNGFHPQSLAQSFRTESFYSLQPSERTASPSTPMPGRSQNEDLDHSPSPPYSTEHSPERQGIDIPWSNRGLLMPPNHRWGLSSQNQRHDGATTSSGSPPDISTAAGSFVTAPATIEGHTTTTESSGGRTISGSWETSTTTNVRPTGTRSGGMVERPGEDMGAGSSWRIL